MDETYPREMETESNDHCACGLGVWGGWERHSSVLRILSASRLSEILRRLESVLALERRRRRSRTGKANEGVRRDD